MKTKILLPTGLILLLFFSACQKDPIKNLKGDETLVYITNRDSTANFSSYSTFSIADSVAVISNNSFVKRERTDLDAALINAVVSNMQQRGYTLQPVHAGADVGITISRIYNDYSRVINYGDYWGDYGGYWDPYYWGYPGYSYYYPNFYGVYTVTDGAVEVDMFDLKNAQSNNNQLKYLWNGMIRGTGTFSPGMAASSVSALFSQSSYISK